MLIDKIEIFLKRYIEKSKKLNKNNEKLIICSICKNNKFYKIAKEGLAINIKCIKCETLFNYTPFGLYIIQKGII